MLSHPTGDGARHLPTRDGPKQDLGREQGTGEAQGEQPAAEPGPGSSGWYHGEVFAVSE